MTPAADYKKHTAALTAVFILGSSVIRMPAVSGGGYTFWGFLLCAVLTLAVYFPALFVWELIMKAASAKGFALKCTAAVLLICTAVYALWNAAEAFRSFTDFSAKLLLPETPEFFLILPLAAVAAALAASRREVLLKFSLIGFVIVLVTAALFFALSAKDFDFGSIAAYRLPRTDEAKAAVVPFLKGILLPSLLIPPMQAVYLEKTRPAAAASGLAAGFAVFALCLLDSLLLFGAELAAQIEYPLCAAVSTVTIGPLFSRMDGLAYLLYFISSLVKTVFCLKLCFAALKKTNGILR